MIDLHQIPSPQILPGTSENNYRDPAALYDGVFHLWFTVNQPRMDGKSMVSFLGSTRSEDLIHWEPVKLLTPEDPALNYSSPGNVIRFQVKGKTGKRENRPWAETKARGGGLGRSSHPPFQYVILARYYTYFSAKRQGFFTYSRRHYASCTPTGRFLKFV